MSSKFEKWKNRKLGNKNLSNKAEKLLESCWNAALKEAKKPCDNLIADPLGSNLLNKIDEIKV